MLIVQTTLALVQVIQQRLNPAALRDLLQGIGEQRPDLVAELQEHLSRQEELLQDEEQEGEREEDRSVYGSAQEDEDFQEGDHNNEDEERGEVDPNERAIMHAMGFACGDETEEERAAHGGLQDLQ